VMREGAPMLVCTRLCRPCEETSRLRVPSVKREADWAEETSGRGAHKCEIASVKMLGVVHDKTNGVDMP
jgi:hypothetical protein